MLLASCRSHLWASNCLRRLSWASDVLFSISKGTLKFVAQPVQTPMAETVPIDLTTLRLRFCVARFSFGSFSGDLPFGRSAFHAAALARAIVVILWTSSFPHAELHKLPLLIARRSDLGSASGNVPDSV